MRPPVTPPTQANAETPPADEGFLAALERGDPAPETGDASEASSDNGEAETPSPWFRRGDQVVLAVLCAGLLVLSGWHWARLSGWGLRPVEIERHPSRRYEYRIDVNTATWVEWIQLPGVGETLARRIVEHRERHGPFRRIEDLDEIHGIGPKTIEDLRPYLRVTQSESVQP